MSRMDLGSGNWIRYTRWEEADIVSFPFQTSRTSTGCVYYAVISVPSHVSARGQDRTFATYISQNVTPCDYILSSYFGNQAIRSKDIHYYWSMLGHIDIVGAAAMNRNVIKGLPCMYGSPFSFHFPVIFHLNPSASDCGSTGW